MAKLLYQGHGSYRFSLSNGKVIYVDPYAGEGYDLPADLVIVTHQHHDHNQIHMVHQKPNCVVITNKEALEGGVHNSFDMEGIHIEAVEAYNVHHKVDECVGYILSFEGVKIYCSGDTSRTKQMETFAKLSLDYAILCCDGIYNMNIDEAAKCAKIIGAKYNIPVHMRPGNLFDRVCAESFNAPNRLILEPGEEINLLSGQN